MLLLKTCVVDGGSSLRAAMSQPLSLGHSFDIVSRDNPMPDAETGTTEASASARSRLVLLSQRRQARDKINDY